MSEITAKIRSELGKKTSALRREGFLPAVLYGQGVSSISLSVPMKEFEKVLDQAGETSLVTLKLEGGKAYEVLIHEVAKDPLTLKPIHADFYAVKLDKPIEAKVPLEFIGESPAVKNEGGILVKVLHELEIKALPKDLPHGIKVDLSGLEKVDGKIHIKDIILPNGVSVNLNLEEVVVLVEPPREEAEAAAPAEEVAPTEVKTEREVKAEEKAKEAEAKEVEE